MGCGCARKASGMRKRTSNKQSKNTIVRKKRVSRLISIPGSAKGKKITKKTKG